MQRKKMEYELRKEMIAEQQALEEAEKKQVIDKVASLLELSFLSFDQRQFDKVILLCDKILDLDPNYIVARNLKEDAYKAKDKYEYKDIAMKKIWGWKAMLRENKEAKIPFQDILKFPDRKKWREVQKRADDLATQDIISDRESASELKKKTQSDIETKRLSLVQMDGNKSLEEIIADLQVQTGLQVMLDPEVKNPPDGVAEKPDVEKPMPAFSLKNIPIKKYLEIILDNYSLDFFIDETGIIHITLPIFARGKPILETYNLTDILFKVRDFSAPTSSFGLDEKAILQQASQFAGDEGSEREMFTGDDIKNLIRNNIEPGTWDNPLFTLEITDNNVLVVKHNIKAHKEIQNFLKKLRENTGLMIVVRSRFITTFDDFLRDIGINIVQDPNITAAQDYDLYGMLTSGTSSADIDEFTLFGPGYINNHLDGSKSEGFDLRGHTFHSFMTQNFIISQVNQVNPNAANTTNPNMDSTQASNRLTDTGGLGLQYQILGKKSLQFVLRAVQKHSKATVVESPLINVLNTRKGFISQIRVTPYVKDYSVVPIGLVALHDPEIGYFSEGFKLEVKGIVSHDRKYVTLTVEASMATFRGFRPDPRDIHIPSGLELTTIQLPWIQQQSAKLSAMIPDQGTLVVSGLKNLDEKLHKSGVPFIENIPIINALFARKVRRNESSNTYILITPEIVDVNEKEREFTD